jgi:uncharacterized protein YkwD
MAAEAADSLDALRAMALDLVNEDRRQHGLAPLEADPALAKATQRHAEDMLSRGYFAHESPEGKTVLDRFVAAGGSRWRKVAENIGRCTGCGSTATAEDVRRFETGWMHSEPHRANILDPGLQSFGYGIAAGNDRQYAVQTFAGPGGPRDLEAGQKAQTLPEDKRTEAALALINGKRQAENAPPLEASAALAEAAGTLLERLTEGAEGPAARQLGGDALLDALPDGQRQRWRELAVIVGVCGGCGERPTLADLRFFVGKWMENPDYRARLLDSDFTHLGFALSADGQGRKTALAMFGRRGGG